MKQSHFLFLIVLSVLTFSSCKSKEEKAADLIKNELSKSLYDFESYEPIETTVSEAYNTAYNDSTCHQLARITAYAMKEASDAFDEANEAKEGMDIWGPPTYYSSSYSDNKYYKYKSTYEKKTEEALTAYSVFQAIGKSLEDSIKALDTSKKIGWEVKHRFRCKTRGGNYSIGDYRYVIDKDFKKVIFYDDTDEKEYKYSQDIIESAIKGDLSKD